VINGRRFTTAVKARVIVSPKYLLTKPSPLTR